MKKVLCKNALTLSLASLLLIYHLVAIANRHEFLSLGQRQESFIQIRVGDWYSNKIKFLSYGDLKYGESFDYVSKKIKQISYIFRYMVNQVPNFVILGLKEPFQRFYLREEICASYKKEAQQRVRSGIWMAKLIADFEAHGVTLIVVPIPTKISIEREFLPSKLPSCVLWGVAAKDSAELEEYSYENYKAFVDGSPSHILDLYQTYRDYLKHSPGNYVYVPSDTHWSSLGIALAVKEVVYKLKKMGWALGEADLELRSFESAYGEFLSYLQLPDFYVRRSNNLQWTEPLYTVNTNANPPHTNRGSDCFAWHQLQCQIEGHRMGIRQIII